MKLTKHPWEQVEFELYKDNEPTGKTYILNDDNNWCIEEWLDDKHDWDFREINIPRGYTPKYRTYEDDGVITYSVRNAMITTLTIECLFINVDESIRPSKIIFNRTDNDGNNLCYNYGQTNMFNIDENEINLIEPINYENSKGDEISDFAEGGLYSYIKATEYINSTQRRLKIIFFHKSDDYVTSDNLISILNDYVKNDELTSILKDALQDEFYSKKEIDNLINELKKDKNVDAINKLNKKIQKIARDVDNLFKLLTLIIKNYN